MKICKSCKHKRLIETIGKKMTVASIPTYYGLCDDCHTTNELYEFKVEA